MKRLRIWWHRRQLRGTVTALEVYVASSAFDLAISTYDYRRRVHALRGKAYSHWAALHDLGVEEPKPWE